MGNREALLEAAIVCLRERGFGGTRARDLASMAGVSLGAISYHFGSTEALLNEAIAESSRRWIDGFKSSMAAAANAEAGLEGAAEGLYQVFNANRELLIGFVEAFAHAQRSATARAQLAMHYNEFRGEVAAALRAADPPSGDAEGVASMVIALVDGLMIQWLLAPEQSPDPKLLRRSASALAALLKTAPTPG
jgi:AcrR family transcriptional regulator